MSCLKYSDGTCDCHFQLNEAKDVMRRTIELLRNFPGDGFMPEVVTQAIERLAKFLGYERGLK